VILDPLTAIAYTAFLVAVTLMTMRRASYGICTLIVVQPFAFYQDVVSTTITLPKVALIGVLLGLLAYRDAFAAAGERAPAAIVPRKRRPRQFNRRRRRTIGPRPVA